MKIKFILLTIIFFAGIMRNSHAQSNPKAGPSDTLVVLWSSGDPYAGAAKRFGWFREVILIVWGPSEKLLTENTVLKNKVAELEKEGVIVEACVACSNMYGVTNELKVCQVDVKGMGVPLTHYLKRGYKTVCY